MALCMRQQAIAAIHAKVGERSLAPHTSTQLACSLLMPPAYGTGTGTCQWAGLSQPQQTAHADMHATHVRRSCA